ncbi:LacX protein, plasmid [Streptococcus sp. DD10]|nr:aldose 1-epimerase family protein [Streptococcus sp. DD10]KXT72420.1 LacX protein, plasmid [Streptococcus sp. DD10]
MIELKNEFLTLQFKELGGALSSIKDTEGIEYLWQGNPTYWSSQAPVLFPICGSLRNDSAIYRPNDRPYFTGIIPRHGLVRKEIFELVEQTENSVSFAIESTERMYKNYPYHFRLTICYTLIGKKIRTQYIVTNLESEKTMPYFVGGHPGFNCPLLDGEVYEDYYLEFEQEETCSVPLSIPETGMLNLLDRRLFLDHQKELPLDYHLFEKDAVTLDQLESRSISLKSRNHEKGLRLNFEDFPYLILWSTTNKGPFIAIEPWLGLSTSLEESDYLEYKKNAHILLAGQTEEVGFEIEIF